MRREVKINIIALLRAAILSTGLFCFAMPAAASYLPFNTSVNMNVGIGTSTPQAAFVVTNGNVGIGTWTASTALLQVGPFASINAGGSANLTGLLLESNSSLISNTSLVSGSNLKIVGGNNANSFLTFQPSGKTGNGDYIDFEEGNVGVGTVDVMRMVNGNVGIGSTAPGQALDVNGTARMGGFTLTGNGAANGNVLVGNSVGVGTWMPASALGIAGGSGTNYWLNDTTGNVGISTAYAVGIGTTFVGGPSEAALSVMNGNVGIGTWVPSVNLDVRGNITAENGNVRAGGFGNFTSADTIVFNDGSSGVNVETNSLSRMYVTPSGNVGIGTVTPAGGLIVMNGNVGIGTWVPGSALTVNGNIQFNNAIDTNPGLTGPNVIGEGLWFGPNSGAGGVSIQNQSNEMRLKFGSTSGTLTFSNGNGQLFEINSNGNVGIGSSNPGQTLDVNGTARVGGFTLTGNGAANGNVLVSNSVGIGTWMAASALGTLVGSNYWLNDTTGNVGISTAYAVGIGTSFVGGPSEAALSVMNGNVGIGTWTPNYSLSVLGNANIGGSGINGNLYVDNTNGATITLAGNSGNITANTMTGFSSVAPLSIMGGSGQGVVLSYNQSALNVGVSVTSTGNVGIGTISPVAGLGIVGDVGIGTGINSPYVTTIPPSGGMIVQGNVGVGSLAPGQVLDVHGTVRMTGLILTGNGAANGNVLVGNSIGVGTWMPVSNLLASGGTNYWLNDTAGNIGISTTYAVGIGTSFVGGPSEAALSVMNGNVGIGTWVPNMALSVQGGNVGIGTASAQAELHVVAASAGNVVSAFQGTTSQSGDIMEWSNSNGLVMDKIGSNGTVSFANNGGGTFNFSVDTNGGTTTGYEYDNGFLYVTGNVGIGTLLPGQKLDVQGTVRTIGLTMSGQTPVSGYVLTASDSSGDATWSPSSSVGTNYWRNDTTGNVGISTTYAVGIGTTFVGGAGEAALSVMNGNVGIGTWAPQTLFQLGPINGVSGAPYQAFLAQATTIGNSYPQLVGNWNPTGYWGIGPATVSTTDNTIMIGGTTNVGQPWSSLKLNFVIPGNIGIGTINTTGMSGALYVNGNVGIGSLSPGQAIDVQGTVRAIGLTMSGQTPISGYVLTASDSIGDATWSPSSSVGTNYWLNDNAGNVGISTTYAVGIGTTFVGGANEAAFAVMNGNIGIGTWLPGTGIKNATGPFPGVSLDIEGSNPAGPAALINNSHGDGIYAFDNSGDGVGVANGFGSDAAVFAFDSNGDVGELADFGDSAALYGNSSTNYGVYAQAPLDYFSGNVGIGSLAPGQLLDVRGTARMTGFDLTSGAASGYVMVSNSIGVGTWMPTNTLPVATVTTETPGDVTYYSSTTGLAGGPGFQTNGTNVGIGTSNFTHASLQIVGNIGIGTVKNGDAFITTSPPNGGMIVEGNVGIGTPITASLLQLGPGTSSKPPITLATGTIGAGGTGTAGAIEFDGTAFYDTAVPSSRQVIDSEQFVALTNNFTLVNGSSAQPAFGGTGAPANGTLTVVPHTTYLFEALYLISNGTTTHETAVGFGGTATITSVDYSSYIWSVNANTPTTAQTFEWIQSAAMTNCNSTQSASNSTTIVLKGIIRIGASSGTNTIIPEIAFGHVPGGTNTMNNDSYFRIYPLGADTTVYQGDWS